ncbi:unnamed protein product, partial [Iphiclides podalirius]
MSRCVRALANNRVVQSSEASRCGDRGAEAARRGAFERAGRANRAQPRLAPGRKVERPLARNGARSAFLAAAAVFEHRQEISFWREDEIALHRQATDRWQYNLSNEKLGEEYFRERWDFMQGIAI